MAAKHCRDGPGNVKLEATTVSLNLFFLIEGSSCSLRAKAVTTNTTSMGHQNQHRKKNSHVFAIFRSIELILMLLVVLLSSL